MSASDAPQLYFVALLPDEPIQREVTAFKQVAAERFGSRHALKSPPHITIIPPFKVPPAEVPAILGAMEAAASRLTPFEVQLRGFDHFGSRVIFVEVVMDEFLSTCQQITAEVFHKQLGIEPDSRPFHAHMTVAFKDLARQEFTKAWGYFSQVPYEQTFTARALTLLRHNGQRWEVAEQINLVLA